MDHLSLKDHNVIMKTQNHDDRITIQWSIRNFVKFPGEIRSSKFSIVSGNSCDWEIIISLFPDNMFKVELAYLAQEDEVPVSVKTVMRMLKNEGIALEGTYHSTNIFYGGEQKPVLSRDDFRVSEDDTLIFQFSMTAHGRICSHHHDNDDGKDIEELRSNCLSMWKSEEFADVKINVGEKCFAAHKCVLKSLAPKFFSEHQEGIRKGQFTLPDDVTPEVFEAVLQHIYDGEVNQLVIALDFEKLYALAFRYELKGLLRESIDEMIVNMNLDNALRFYKLAEENKDEKLMMYCWSFVEDNLPDSKSDPHYKQLTASRPDFPKIVESKNDQDVTEN